MFRKIIFGLACALFVAAGVMVATAHAGNEPVRASQAPRAALITPTPPYVQDSDNRVWLSGWGGGTADGGYNYRSSVLQGQTTSFRFTGTAVKWLTDKLAIAGIAQVWIDGVNKGKFDLYPQGNQQYETAITFSGLANKAHTITIQNTGTKNVHALNTSVFVDGFKVGSTTYTANSHRITYGDWRGAFNANALGGSYRYAESSTAQALLHFTAGNIAWVTATGPNYGKAWVIIDGVSKGYVDLYSATQQWQVYKWYYVGNGPHTIQLIPLGQKNSKSKGYGVVLDAFLPG